MIENFEDCITDQQRQAFNRGGEYGIILAASQALFNSKSETEGDAFRAGFEAGMKIFAERADENLEAAILAAKKMAEMNLSMGDE